MKNEDLNTLKAYLSEEEIKQIVIDEYRSIIKAEISAVLPEKRLSNMERIVSNAVYYFIQEEGDKLIGQSVVGVIHDKVKSVIAKADYSLTVFRRKSDWEKEDSKAQTLLNEAVSANKDLIYSKVEEQINALDIKAIKDLIIESTVDFLTEKFKS